MIHRLRRLVLPLLLLSAAGGVGAVPTLTLITPQQLGRPGEVVGWDFVLVNDSIYDLSVTGVYADGDLFGTDGTSDVGEFVDAISAWSVATGGLRIEANQAYNGRFPMTPLATFVLNMHFARAAPPVTGHIFLAYELYNELAEFQAAGVLTALFEGQDALASVAVPAPATAALLALGLAGLARRRTWTGAKSRGNVTAPATPAAPLPGRPLRVRADG